MGWRTHFYIWQQTIALSVYVVDKPVPVYHWKSFQSVSGEERLKMGWVVKKSVFSFLNALVSTKIHSYSKPVYFAINIYQPKKKHRYQMFHFY